MPAGSEHQPEKYRDRLAAAECRPGRRELFKDENDENSENNCNGGNRRLVIDDHDYGNNGANR